MDAEDFACMIGVGQNAEHFFFSSCASNDSFDNIEWTSVLSVGEDSTLQDGTHF